MCFPANSRYIILFALIFACCTTLPDKYHNQFEGITADSLKKVLKTPKIATQMKMSASGMLGLHYFMAGEYDSARMCLKLALSLPGGSEYQGGRFITNLANTYAFEGKYIEAMKYYIEALHVSNHLVTINKHKGPAKFNVIRAMANLSEMYYLTGNRQQALYYARQAEKLSEGLGPHYIMPQCYYIIGSIYVDQGDWSEAEKFMQETYDVADSILQIRLNDDGNPLGMYMYVAYGLEGLSKTALARQDHARALEHAVRALDYALLNGDPTVTAKILSTVSDIYLTTGNYGESERYARKALEIYPSHWKVKPEVMYNIASARLFDSDRDSAYAYFRLYSAGMKENNDRQFHETMAGMEVVYETQRRESRIANLEQQRILFFIACVVFLMLVMAVWVILRQKIKNEQREKQFIAANAILEWEKKERKRFASDLHDGINGMLSAIKLELSAVENLKNIRDQLDDCIETIRRMSRSRIPVSLERYGLKAALEDYCRLFPNVYFHFLGENKRMNERLELTIYYCTYELVNNAVKHSAAETINVELVQDGGIIALTVQDDGRGFDEHAAMGGAGLKNISDRVTTLGGKIDIAASSGKGVEINIEFEENT